MATGDSHDTLLGGTRVLDMTDEQGQYCGKLLAEYGADVIKIEPPGGDPSRRIGPFRGDVIDPEQSLLWLALNTSKRGVTLSLDAAEGRELFTKLVRTTDFVIESFEPGSLAERELAYRDLARINPRLVMTSITPFGQTGPHARYKVADIVMWAMSGYMYVCAEMDTGEPYRVGLSNYQGSLHGAMGTMIAHYHREMTGEGQHVDVSIQEALTGFLMNTEETWDLYEVNIRGAGPNYLTPRPAPRGALRTRLHWPCRDGYVSFFLGGGGVQQMLNSTRAMVDLADAAGMGDILKKYDWTKYDTSKITQEERNMLEEEFLRFFRTKTKDELYRAAIERAIACSPLNTVEEIVASPQLAERGYFVEIDDPERGAPLKHPGAPVKLVEAPYRITRRAPRIGEHNVEVYQGEMGLTATDLDRLRDAGAI
jgi:crotonobetainyl-CoA:carnitine CoA-transferase CaiB-like acyl-CoA transferase